MGFFKDISTLKAQAKEIDKTFDPGQQARDATERMRALNQNMAQATAALTAPPEDGIEATAQVVTVGMTAGMINMDPLVPVDLLVQQPGMPPRPVATSIVVPITALHRVQVGATLPVRISRSDPSALAVDWAAPA